MQKSLFISFVSKISCGFRPIREEIWDDYLQDYNYSDSEEKEWVFIERVPLKVHRRISNRNTRVNYLCACEFGGECGDGHLPTFQQIRKVFGSNFREPIPLRNACKFRYSRQGDLEKLMENIQKAKK